jgi:hypothetical protein
MVVSHRHPVVRGLMPPPVTLCHRPGESPHAGICMGLFFCRDVGLCLLIGVGLQLPCQFPPWRCSLNYRSSSLPERGSLTVMRASSSCGRSLVAFAHTLRKARVGRDAICAHTDAIQRHYLTQVSASSS